MRNVRELKKRADSMLEEVFRSLFEEIDTEKIRHDVAALKERTPDFHEHDHARMLVRRAALRCAAAGAVSGLPSGVIAIGTLGAELAYLVFQQFRLILGIATVYGHEPSQRERFAEAFSCLAYASGVGIGRQGIATVLESATIEGGVIAEKLGANFFRERLAKMIPFVGVVSGGALNYVSVRAVGRAAIRFYESQIGAIEADAIWADGDREHA
jgi:hypothetical protein